MDYSQPHHVALFGVRSIGGLPSPCQWMRNGVKQEEEVHPLLYTTTRGDYTCKITGDDRNQRNVILK